MSSLLSASKLRYGGSGEFLQLAGAMPQLPETTSTTGFTLITNRLLQTRYASSLGNIEFDQAQMYSNLSEGTVRILMTGTTSISTNSDSGTLVVTGGVGIGKNLWVKQDIHVNDLTIGQGIDNGNNIAIIGTYTEFTSGDGQNNITIGYNALTQSIKAYRSIAIGNYALSEGIGITDSIAIGNGALRYLGTVPEVAVATISNATQTNPVMITTDGSHGLISGDRILITDVVEMVELNDQKFYVLVLDPQTITLYSDSILFSKIDGTGYTAYTTFGGTVSRYVLSNNNIAIGIDAGKNLIEGRKNFFFGDRAADALVNGSSNIIVGSDVARNMITGNANISIGGDNLVDGIDNQINIGSVFYYDGLGNLDVNSNTNLGLGQEAVSTSTGALTVSGGISTHYSVYSREGNPEENYLLYTPRVFVTSTQPLGPRISDFWIFNDGLGTSSYLQYVRDGTDTFWLQVGLI
jgi:hypothetical protein